MEPNRIVAQAGPSKDVYVSKVGDPAVTVKGGGSRWEVSGVASWGAGDHCTKVYANVYCEFPEQPTLLLEIAISNC